MTEVLQTALDGRVLRVALNRPEKRNALNLELCRELVAALDRADSDPKAGAVLLSGNGKAFCAGMDLNEVLSAPQGPLGKVHEQLFIAGARMTKPVVAAVQGPALAGGTGLVANAHIVVASEDATFGLTEIRIGLWPFLIFRGIRAALGERRALELSLTGRVFGAQEALQFGLVHHVVPGAELDARAFEIASTLAAASPMALRSGLMFVQQTRGKSWTDAGEIARQIRDQVFQGEDFQEGIRAFREKRQPHWPSIV